MCKLGKEYQQGVVGLQTSLNTQNTCDKGCPSKLATSLPCVF